VRKQAMVTHTDSDIDRNYVESNGDNKHRPTKEEERCDGSNVEENHKAQYQPIQRQLLCIARERKHRRPPRRYRTLSTRRRQANIVANTLILNRHKGWNAYYHSHLSDDLFAPFHSS
jgi:hypothetical protein